jgi:hypothetical protein
MKRIVKGGSLMEWKTDVTRTLLFRIGSNPIYASTPMIFVGCPNEIPKFCDPRDQSYIVERKIKMSPEL